MSSRNTISKVLARTPSQIARIKTTIDNFRQLTNESKTKKQYQTNFWKIKWPTLMNPDIVRCEPVNNTQWAMVRFAMIPKIKQPSQGFMMAISSLPLKFQHDITLGGICKDNDRCYHHHPAEKFTTTTTTMVTRRGAAIKKQKLATTTSVDVAANDNGDNLQYSDMSPIQKQYIKLTIDNYSKDGIFSFKHPDWKNLQILQVGSWYLQECDGAVQPQQQQKQLWDDDADSDDVPDESRKSRYGIPKSKYGKWEFVRAVTDISNRVWAVPAHVWQGYREINIKNRYGGDQNREDFDARMKSYRFQTSVTRAKVKQNADFCEALKPHFRDYGKNGKISDSPPLEDGNYENKYHILALDDEHGMSSQYYRCVLNRSPEEIHIPNPYIAEMKYKHNTHYDTSLFEFIRDMPYSDRDKFAGVNLDYCCSFNGAETGTRPRADLGMLFARQLLQPENGVLSCTFALRSGLGDIDSKVREAFDFIIDTAVVFGYDLELLNSGRGEQLYYGLGGSFMVNLLFRSNALYSSRDKVLGGHLLLGKQFKFVITEESPPKAVKNGKKTKSELETEGKLQRLQSAVQQFTLTMKHDICKSKVKSKTSANATNKSILQSINKLKRQLDTDMM